MNHLILVSLKQGWVSKRFFTEGHIVKKSYQGGPLSEVIGFTSQKAPLVGSVFWPDTVVFLYIITTQERYLVTN